MQLYRETLFDYNQINYNWALVAFKKFKPPLFKNFWEPPVYAGQSYFKWSRV